MHGNNKWPLENALVGFKKNKKLSTMNNKYPTSNKRNRIKLIYVNQELASTRSIQVSIVI